MAALGAVIWNYVRGPGPAIVCACASGGGTFGIRRPVVLPVSAADVPPLLPVIVVLLAAADLFLRRPVTSSSFLVNAFLINASSYCGSETHTQQAAAAVTATAAATTPAADDSNNVTEDPHRENMKS